MIQVSLLEFAKTGRLGPIGLGCSRSEIMALLGKPPNWSTDHDAHAKKDFLQATIWLYGDIELYFKHDQLVMIYTDHQNLSGGTKRLQIEPWVVRMDLPLADFTAELGHQNLGYRIEQRVDQTNVVVNGMATFGFYATETSNEPVLSSWHCGLYS